MLEVVLTHVVLKLSFQLLFAFLIIKLNPVWLFNFHFELVASFSNVIIDFISLFKPSLTIDHDPFILKKRGTLVDRQFTKSLLIARQRVVAHADDLRSCQDGTLDADRSVLNLQVPIFHRLLILQLITHVLDFLHLLTWRTSSHG